MKTNKFWVCGWILTSLWASAGCGGKGATVPSAAWSPKMVTPSMVENAKTKWPEASAESLSRGHDTFVSKCNQCHDLPDPSSESEGDWPSILDRMGKNANLSTEQTKEVLHYVLAARGTK